MITSVHLLRPLDSENLIYFQRQLDADLHITAGPDLPDPPEYHVLVAGRPRREHVTASPNLHTLIVPWTGVPNETRDLMLDFPHVSVHNLHYNAIAVAEMAVTLMLAAAKHIVPVDRAFRDHDWTSRYRPTPAILLDGKTALILGYGAIGRRVAQMCRGLGMQVLALRRHVSKPGEGDAYADEIHPPQALDSLLPRADALIICLPHTPETDGLIGAEALNRLSDGALLVNVGRGPVLDQAALYHALKDGPLYAAGLDVWYNYPDDEASRSHTPPSDYPFHELENVVMSPHRAGHVDDRDKSRLDQLAILLNALARGEPAPNKVNLSIGY
ncbi:MAG TPA: hydroxyacid dehydrogenase [Chloroflexi bacterium]|nr:hydroxyacid dehydrogenase [Chloroflexota bacterium]